MPLRGKVVLVTGAGGGLGRQLVLQLSARGALVACVDNRLDGLLETARLVATNIGKVQIFHCDVTDETATSEMFRQLIEQHGRVEILINNAAIEQLRQNIASIPSSNLSKVLAINFYAPVRLIKLFIAQNLESAKPVIVNICSVQSFAALPNSAMYSATKAALRIFSLALRQELTDRKIRVIEVYPGAIESTLGQNSGNQRGVRRSTMPKLPKLSASRVAQRIVRALGGSEVRITIGLTARLVLIVSRWFPTKSTSALFLLNRLYF